jgi:hypothetical protein
LTSRSQLINISVQKEKLNRLGRWNYGTYHLLTRISD